MYRVLIPKYEKTGEVTQAPEGNIHWQRVARWIELGTARDMKEAREKFKPSHWLGCYSLVLEEIGAVH